MLRTSAILGLIAAVTMVAIKSILGERLWWPFAIVEFCAAGLLLTGAFVALRIERGSLLAAGWGFTGGITWSTLFHHLQSKPALTGLEYGLGLLLAVSGLGIALACVASVRPPHLKPTLTVGGIVIASLVALSQIFVPFGAKAQVPSNNLFGHWVTEGSGSIVDIQECAGNASRMLVCGRIVWLRHAKGSDGLERRDDNNPDRALRTRSLVGIELFRGFRAVSPGVWKGNTLYNPDDGRTYSGTLRLRKGALELQGCALRVFCKTQTWSRPRTSSTH